MGSYGQHSASGTQVSTDSYTSITLTPPSGIDSATSGPTTFRVTGGGPVGVMVYNSGANSIDCVLRAGFLDTAGTLRAVAITTTELTGIAASTAKAYQLTAVGYLYLDVQVKATAGGSQGTANLLINQNPVS